MRNWMACRWRLSATLLLLWTVGCDELGPDAKGEIGTTALAGVADERTCMPLFDMTRVRGSDGGGLEFVLRDGARWRNGLQGRCDALAGDFRLAFAADTNDLCRSDQVLVLRPVSVGFRHVETCTLGSFRRFERVSRP